MSTVAQPFTKLQSHPGRQIVGALAGPCVDTSDKLKTQNDIEQKLQALAAKDGIRIKEFFLDFDKLRKGWVGEAAFRTCVGTLNVKLDASEIDYLINKYRVQGQPGLIQYSTFIDNINHVFSDLANPTAVVEEAKSSALFSESEQGQIMNMLDVFRNEITSKRILLKPGFHDFDKAKSQHVTANQFVRVLKTLGLMPPTTAQFALLTRKYCDLGNTQEINYYHFCKDIDRRSDIFPKYNAKRAGATLDPETNWPVPNYDHGDHRTQKNTFFNQSTADLDVLNNRFMQPKVDVACDPSDIEERIRSVCVMKRVRIEEFFRDFDKLRKGRVTRNQFKGILSSMNFALTDDEFEALCNTYKTNDPEVFFNYVAFTASINKAFTITGIDKAPLTRVNAQSNDDTLLARRKYLAENNTSVDMNDVITQYRDAIKQRRMHLKPVFQDFDITKNGHVTKMQFLRVLNLLRVSAPEDVTAQILRRYMDKGNVDEVNYVDFCEDVDGSSDLFGVGRDFNHSWNLFPKTDSRISGNETMQHCASPDDLDDVIARIRTNCSQQRIRVGEFFRDFDKLRSGFITAQQFRIGLNMAKLNISNAEFQMICNSFKAPKAGDHINWRDFCDSVDEVFTKKGLEKNIDTPLDAARTQTLYGRAAATRDETSQVQSILDGFTEIIRKNRLDAKSFFQDWDRHKHFKVSQKQFRQVLVLLGYQLSVEQVNCVATKYGEANGEIRYADFLRDANCLEYIINGPTTELKSTYVKKWTDFNGAKQHDELMRKIMNQCKKDRIRLLEFFQDHDILRKGYVPRQKFRNVLHIQKIMLTIPEYEALETNYMVPNDPTLVNYTRFNAEIEDIFTEKDLEKNPTKTLKSFNAPSILDPKDCLNGEEEQLLHATLCRLAEQVRLRRLLIKPFFQDKDRSRSGFISMTRFRSIFDNVKLLCNEQEFALINKRFQAKAADEINYVEFDHVLREYSGDHKPF